ncbi:MAG: D-alanyl-D-alanine carboxypeptidase [Clostridioides sp.]|jgi:D-alanyl-D-alanine carboxypeptidase|nr:D-alanyl-D-alanine carboxypeptidase [Clostridioides sp.]
MKKIIKTITVLLLTLMIVSPYAVYADEGSNVDKYSKGSIVIDQDSGRVLLAKNPDDKLPLASLTKMMTFTLAIEAIENGEVKPTDLVTIDKEIASTKGSSYNLKVGEKVPLIELMKGLMIVSGNDAAVAIAKYVGGTKAEFVDEMNVKANELGMKNTKYYNVNGLPIYDMKDTKKPATENVSSARDIATLGKYMMDNYEKQVTSITDMQIYTNPDRNFVKGNTNGALMGMIPEVDGIKTGYTGNAGYCLSFSMMIDKDEKNDKKRRVIGVTLGANHKNKRLSAAADMLKYVKKTTSSKKVQTKDSFIGKKYIGGISDLEVMMKTKDDFYAVLKDGEKLKSDIKIDKLSYPVKNGQKIGEIKYTNENGEVLGVKDVVSANNVDSISISNRLKLKLFNEK